MSTSLLDPTQFVAPDDSATLQRQIFEAIDVINDGLRQGLFGMEAAAIMGIGKVIDLRQLDRQQAAPE